MQTPTMPSQPFSRESLRVGGGYSASAAGLSPAGGLDADNAGNLALDGDLTVGGGISLEGQLETANLHNNGGTSAAGAISSGNYTPTATNDTNCASFTGLGTSPWMRVGQVVTVTARIGVNPTADSTLTKFRFTLPIPSDLSSNAHVIGAAAAFGSAYIGGIILGDVANDAALVQFTSVGTGTHFLYCIFQYEVR